jgi:hypothetical protein
MRYLTSQASPNKYNFEGKQHRAAVFDMTVALMAMAQLDT